MVEAWVVEVSPTFIKAGQQFSTSGRVEPQFIRVEKWKIACHCSTILPERF